MSPELFSMIDGIATDTALHEELLNNPAADRMTREMSFRRALARGVPRAEAALLYGIDANLT